MIILWGCRRLEAETVSSVFFPDDYVFEHFDPPYHCGMTYSTIVRGVQYCVGRIGRSAVVCTGHCALAVASEPLPILKQ